MINQRHLGTLKYLLRKRFVEKTMTQENWMEHIQFTIQDNPWLQAKLVQLLVHYGGLQVAAWWALHYSLHGESVPYRVTEEMEELKKQERLDCPEQTGRFGEEDRKKGGYYHLPIPRDQVFFLSTWEEVEKYKEALLQTGQAIGLDMELRPSFGSMGGKPRLSLVQLAIRGHVFLLDMLQLLGQGRPEEEKALAAFFQALFADSTITKLGYGMLGDLRSLTQSCPAFRDVDKPLRACLDLLSVHKQLPRCSKESWKNFREVEAFPAKEEKKWARALPEERGLSLLVQDILGRPLDKTEQLSNWEKRPLRENQVLYAASDAYCLLEVYTKLLENSAAFGLSPEVMAAPTGEPKARAKAKKSTIRQKTTKSSESTPEGAALAALASVSAQDFRVVCDNMLQGLGRYLRCLGLDVRILENEEEHREAAEIARADGRVILTSGLPYQTLQSQVGEGRCFQVDCSEKAKDQAFRVLKHFGVRVTLTDIFSRCQACNCNQYLKISKEKMAHLMKHRGHLAGEGTATGELFADGPVPSLKVETLGFDSQEPAACDPCCQWLEELPLDGATALTLPNNQPLRLEAVPPGILLKEDLDYFYCCSQCGKVFWEGSHFGRLVSQFREVLDLSGNSRSFYEEA